MISINSIINFSGIFVGNFLGFATKQMFILHGLNNVREKLDAIITSVAQKYLGSFMGAAIGAHLASVSAIPYTIFLGDLIWSTVRDLTKIIAMVIADTVSTESIPYQDDLPILLNMAMAVVSVAAGYFVKSIFTFSALATVKTIVEKLLIFCADLGTKNMFVQNVAQFAAQIGAAILAPTVTFIVADIISLAVQAGTYGLMRWIGLFIQRTFFSSKLELHSSFS